MKRILVLDPYLPTLGGGEKHMVYLCKFIEDYFNKNVQIDILVFNYNDINVNDANYITMDKVCNQYGLKLERTYIRKIEPDQPADDRAIEQISKEYDLFINFEIFSRCCNKASKSIYFCMFPPITFTQQYSGQGAIKKLRAKYKDWRFRHSYDLFETNSAYSNYWLHSFWGNVDSRIGFPPCFSETDIHGRYDEALKKNIIISVGRFFVDGHNKKQLEMAGMFANNYDVFSSYEYHLVGQISNYPKDQAYMQQIKDIAKRCPNIIIHENCRYSELVELYKSAKIFWHATGLGIDGEREPEKMEHFGMTTVEAMSFGVVPVVINKGGQKEIVEEDKNGYHWDTLDECVKKTKKIIDDDGKRRKMAAQSVKRATLFSIEVFNKVNKEIFDGLQV